MFPAEKDPTGGRSLVCVSSTTLQAEEADFYPNRSIELDRDGAQTVARQRESICSNKLLH